MNPALITFVASIAAVQGSYDTAYATSKSGHIGCAMSIAKHHAPRLRANVICPGLIKDRGMYKSRSTMIDNKLIESNGYRDDGSAVVSHLRTFYAGLFKK